MIDVENENTTTTTSGAAEPTAAEKTYTRQEYDAQLTAGKAEVYNALGIDEENAEAEIAAFKAWKAEQDKKAADKKPSEAADELTAVKNQVTALTRRLEAVSAGIPTDKAERYVRLAASYMDDGRDFSSALKQALEDFPLPRTAEKQFGGSVSGGKTSALPDEEKIKKIFESKG